VSRGLSALLAAALLAGCSGDEKEAAPKAVEGAPKEVAGAVDRLERAIRARDFEAICDDLFAAETRVRAGGEDCAGLLRSTAAEVREPAIRILSIRIEGERADVRVRSQAEGQGPVEETIELVREEGEYRIAALGG